MKYCKICNQKKEENELKNYMGNTVICLTCEEKQKQKSYTHKICSKCKEKKALKLFNSKGCICKECTNKASKEYRKNNLEKVKARAKEYRKKNYNSLNTYIKRIKRDYGVTLEWYLEQLEKQNGNCAICGRPPPKRKDGIEKLYIDHNHGTGQVRELLCHNCNSMIGQAIESPIILKNAIDYLEKHNKPK